MKKLMIASAIAMSMAAGSAMASQGDIQFFGNVTETTCDLTPEMNGNVGNLVQLGTVAKNTKGQEISIKFKAQDPANASCAALTAQKTASFSWAGNLTADGIGAQGGLATDAYVILTPVDAKNNDVAPITASKTSTDFSADKVINAGVEYKAALQGKDKVGDFQTATAYAVTYK
ncbi:fimbrial protein [Citrobacter sp. A316]|uniref:fimbrial protein n=1 Tax=Citrobacter sp. A316 TaxID=1639132 RepID=UPI0009AE5919|nr:fimbrial protein [Citrobacter sp. A316]OPW88266.1 fimbrial protein [Citrobacter sp. A316]